MKRYISFIIFLTLCYSGAAISDDCNKQPQQAKNFGVMDLEQYRSYPFQWIFPEYYYTAENIRVERMNKPPEGFSKVEFFGLSACIPSEFTEEIKRKHDIMYFKTRNAETIMMIKSSNDPYMCSDDLRAYQKDYCSAYKTPQELFQKLFTLTPETAENVGEKWLVHGKGILFDNTKMIKIYSGDKFIAYVKFIKDSLVKEVKFSHEITLFHTNGPLNSHITISFIDEDDRILNHFISTLE